MTEEGNKPPYSRRIGKSAKRFSINALQKYQHGNEFCTNDALRAEEGNVWVQEKHKEVKTLEGTNWCKPAHKPMHKKVLRTKHALNRRRYETGQAQKYKTRFVIYSSEEQVAHEKVSLLAKLTVVKLFICLAIRKNWHPRLAFLIQVSKWGILWSVIRIFGPARCKWGDDC